MAALSVQDPSVALSLYLDELLSTTLFWVNVPEAEKSKARLVHLKAFLELWILTEYAFVFLLTGVLCAEFYGLNGASNKYMCVIECRCTCAAACT